MQYLSRPVARAVTAAIDNGELAMFGGELSKASLLIYESLDGGVTLSDSPDVFEFFINPHTIHIDKEVEFTETPTVQGTIEIKYASTKPICLNLGEMWFDTYDTRESVRARYIDGLEALLDYRASTHTLHVVKFLWGDFSRGSKVDESYLFLATKLSIDYTLFLPSGLPCRAKVSMCLKQLVTNVKEAHLRPKESPDHARIYTVKRGDTLQGISRFAYEDPREWRRIARANDLDDPMTLRPGQVLMLPPIL